MRRLSSLRPFSVALRSAVARSLALSIAAGVSCTGATESVPVATVSVTAASTSLASGTTLQLVAAPLDRRGALLANRAITWSSSNDSVATVSPSGFVTTGRVLGGTDRAVTIAATSETVSGSVTLFVRPVPVAAVSVTPATPALLVGATQQLTATPRDATGAALTGRTIAWSSSDTTVVTVSTTGLVTAKAYSGAVTRAAVITATSEGQGGTTSVSVTPAPVASVTVSPATATIAVGGTQQLTATLRDAEGTALTGRTVTWTLSDTMVATVSSTGLLTARPYTGPSTRTTTLTATSEGQSGTTNIAVTPALVASITVNPPTATILVGEAQQLTAVLRGASGAVLTERAVGWSVSDTLVATVSSDGYVTGRAGGRVVVTATSEGMIGVASIITRIALPASSPPEAILFSTGLRHTCAIAQNARLYCWGDNSYGQLGTGDRIAQTLPTPVASATAFKSVVAGSLSTCALDIAGVAYCWGNNGEHALPIGWGDSGPGTLGDSSGITRLIPTPVQTNQRFGQLTSGGYFSCGLNQLGDAYCWGRNSEGQLGDGTTVRKMTPVKVSGDLQFLQIDASGLFGHACAISVSGDAYCWGDGDAAPGGRYNGTGQLGNGSIGNRSVPTIVVGGIAFKQLNAGHYATCGVSISGLVYCWGGNQDGQLGDGTTEARLAPVPVLLGKQVVQVASGAFATCALDTDGVAWCWGAGLAGNLGGGVFSALQVTPVRVSETIRFTAIQADDVHVCGSTSARELWCWGGGAFGQLGDGEKVDRSTPVRVGGGLVLRAP